jgi:transposase
MIMAMHTSAVILGIDVSKAWIDVCRSGEEQIERVDNEPAALEALLDRHPTAALAVEATNTYHEQLVESAQRRGLAVYLINGYQLKHYAESLGQRMRSDAIDARLLARFLEREIAGLKPYQAPSRQQIQVRRLLKRRALLVKLQLQLRQSFDGVVDFKTSLDGLLERTKKFILLIDKRLQALARELGWQADLARLRSIPGVGPLTALALLEAYRAGHFVHRDPFVAFLGLDVRTKDSGRHKGRRRLTKQGNPEPRRLLHNAAMSSSCAGRYFQREYLALQARGLSKIQALVVISRKIAKIAFALLKQQTEFDPKIRQRGCAKA